MKMYLVFFLLVFLLAGVYYLLIYSSVFKIRSIAVDNNKFFSETDILEMLRPIILSGKIGSIAGFDNLLAWPEGKISVPNLAIVDVNIDKNWIKRTIRVEVENRQRFAIWCMSSGQNCYWIDKQGIVFGDAPSTEGSLVSVVFDSRSGEMPLGSSVEDGRFIGNLMAILENIGILGIQVDRIDFDNDLQELSVSAVGGPKIKFGLRYDSAKDIPLIQNLNYKDFKFIDLSVEGRIYIPSK